MAVTTRSQQVVGYLPGFGYAAAVTALAWLLAQATGPALSSITIAIVIGIIVANTGLIPESTRPGIAWVGRYLLRLGVVLLGFSIVWDDVRQLGLDGLAALIGIVGASFAVIWWLGRRLGTGDTTSLLIATGTAVCGAAAIAAMAGVRGESKREVSDSTAIAVAMIVFYGTIVLFVYPLLMTPLGLNEVQFGAWTGASVHEVAQVIAAATPAGVTAVEIATVVKLTRVLLLALLVAGVAYAYRNRQMSPEGTGVRSGQLVPPFILAFVGVVALNSIVDLPTGLVDGALTGKDLALTAAMFGVGTNVVIRDLISRGRPALVTGLIGSLFISVLALVLVLVVVP
jgi:uncharacterized integral membrane protein (TIGR00698 family)